MVHYPHAALCAVWFFEVTTGDLRMQKNSATNGTPKLDPRMTSLVHTRETEHFARAAYDLLFEKGADVQCVPVKETKHPNGEWLPEIQTHVRNTICFYFACPEYPTPSDGLMRMELTLNALHNAEPREIHTIAPFVPYLRQDRKSEYRGPISVQVIARKFTYSRSLRTLDMHSPQTEAVFPFATTDLKARDLFAADIRERYPDLSKVVILAPDIGAAKRAEKVAYRAGVPYGIFDKRRTMKDGPTVSSYHGPPLEGMHALFIDDICDTASTLIVTGTDARTRGAASVSAYMSHAVLSTKDGKRAEDKLRAANMHVVATNSVYRPQAYYTDNADWLRMLPLENMLAQTVYQCCLTGGTLMHHGEK